MILYWQLPGAVFFQQGHSRYSKAVSFKLWVVKMPCVGDTVNVNNFNVLCFVKLSEKSLLFRERINSCFCSSI
jgi:hypothetical protein